MLLNQADQLNAVPFLGKAEGKLSPAAPEKVSACLQSFSHPEGTCSWCSPADGICLGYRLRAIHLTFHLISCCPFSWLQEGAQSTWAALCSSWATVKPNSFSGTVESSGKSGPCAADSSDLFFCSLVQNIILDVTWEQEKEKDWWTCRTEGLSECMLPLWSI